MTDFSFWANFSFKLSPVPLFVRETLNNKLEKKKNEMSLQTYWSGRQKQVLFELETQLATVNIEHDD